MICEILQIFSSNQKSRTFRNPRFVMVRDLITSDILLGYWHRNLGCDPRDSYAPSPYSPPPYVSMSHHGCVRAHESCCGWHGHGSVHCPHRVKKSLCSQPSWSP